jgi:ATP-dependent DNA ligase
VRNRWSRCPADLAGAGGVDSAGRLLTRRGHDWTDRYPAIAAAAAKLRAKSITLHGEAVVMGEDGIAVFGALLGRAETRP